MRQKKKGTPENRGADSKMVVEMASGRSKVGFGLTVFVEARAAKAFVGVPIIFCEIEIVLEEGCAGEGVVSDAIAADPGVQKWKRNEEKEKKQTF